MSTLDEKRAAALAYLGTRHCLHREYKRGTVNHDPDRTNVAGTIRRAQREQSKATQSRPAERVVKFRGRQS